MATRKVKKPIARCQCIASCKNPPLEGSPFCAKHLNFCPRRAPLTGAEPDFNPARYNKYKGVKESHNCFAYAFDYYKMPKIQKCTKNSCPIPFPQPGRASGYPKWSQVKGKRCPDLVARLMGDVPGIKMSSFEAKCPPGMAKIVPKVSPKGDDYHFWRQDSNGYWSHKPGATNVTHLDATKRPIYDPKIASSDYKDTGLNYNKFCGYMCVPKTQKHRFKRGGGKRKTKRLSKIQ
jgi:hypothetical protein